MNPLENYFDKFRKNIVGNEFFFHSPYGEKKIIYADWIASGRLYEPIEKQIVEIFGPMVGNTHTETSFTGTSMTRSYHYAHEYIKKHVNASPEDVIISAGSGMTGMVNKFQRILGLKVAEQLKEYTKLPDKLRPVVFITHMEHHSNQTSWLETIAEVKVIEPNDAGLVDLDNLRGLLKKYENRKLKIGSFTACSNVTGIETPVHELAKIMHENGGFCFVDYACSAPYVNISMHPEDPLEKLDAIFFSPHKFLGGPGTPGVLIFDSKLYHNLVPDHPGGGTVDWTNPWGQYQFVKSIEAREDGGTPAFLQTIKAALAIKLKEEMGAENIKRREEELVKIALAGLKEIPHVHILAQNIEERLGAISFYVDDIHYNLMVKLLNDQFGIQMRGGCSCAGTYGHFLLHVDPNRSRAITEKINEGDFSDKPGWVRMSLHPTMTNAEVEFITDSIKYIVKNIDGLSKDYKYDKLKNEYYHKTFEKENSKFIEKLFDLSS